jgi:hypothetical protein
MALRASRRLSEMSFCQMDSPLCCAAVASPFLRKLISFFQIETGGSGGASRVSVSVAVPSTTGACCAGLRLKLISFFQNDSGAASTNSTSISTGGRAGAGAGAGSGAAAGSTAGAAAVAACAASSSLRWNSSSFVRSTSSTPDGSSSFGVRLKPISFFQIESLMRSLRQRGGRRQAAAAAAWRSARARP